MTASADDVLAGLDEDTSLDLAALGAPADAAMAGEVMRDRLSDWRSAARCVANDGVWPCRPCLFDLTRDLGHVAARGLCFEHPTPTP